MTTLIISLPAIFNVGALLLLFFFIYSYMGALPSCSFLLFSLLFCCPSLHSHNVPSCSSSSSTTRTWVRNLSLCLHAS